MRSLPTQQHLFTKRLLLAAAVLSIAATGFFASSAILGQQYPSLAFAQQELGLTDTTTDTDTTTTTTTTDNATTEGTTTTTPDTATTGTNKVAGIIASLQLAPDRLAPEWVTAGYWELESDMPLFGGTTETRPTVTSFDAIVEMVHLADGTALHSHTFSDFRQTDIISAAENTTTIQGTMTVSLQEGPVQNVPVFITLQNNLLSIATDPAATENHFGPTPINGIILAPEHLQQISNRLAPTAAEGGEGGGSAVTGTIGDSAGQ
jgi:hypothetical protein